MLLISAVIDGMHRRFVHDGLQNVQYIPAHAKQLRNPNEHHFLVSSTRHTWGDPKVTRSFFKKSYISLNISTI